VGGGSVIGSWRVDGDGERDGEGEGLRTADPELVDDRGSRGPEGLVVQVETPREREHVGDVQGGGGGAVVDGSGVAGGADAAGGEVPMGGF
jgi:hypothetical protein